MTTISPTWPQYDLYACQAKYPAIVGGFGSGKTEALINLGIFWKLQFPGVDIAYYGPTYDLVFAMAWPRFIEKLTEMGLYVRPNIQKRQLHIQGYSSILFRTMNKPENIIGYEVGRSLADELDTLPTKKAADVFGRIVSRNRSKMPDGASNNIAVGTTPEGYRFTYDRWEKNKTEHHTLIRASTHSNRRNLPPDYIENIRMSYSPDVVEAYLEGRFINMQSGNVYSMFDRDANGTNEAIGEHETLHIGMDFNIRNMHAAIFVVRRNPILSRGVNVLLLDEIAGGQDTPSMIAAIKDRYSGRSITIFPDATAKNATTKSITESDITLLKDAGFTVRSNPGNPAIKDRVASVNGLLCNVDQERHFLINSDNCPVSTEALEKQAWGQDGLPDKTTGLDHIADAIGYYIHHRYPVKRKTKRIIIAKAA